MKKKQLTITIRGQVMSGKSRVLFFLKKILKEKGFDVMFEPDLDHPSEAALDRTMGENNEEIIEAMKDRVNIVMKTEQAPYNSQEW